MQNVYIELQVKVRLCRFSKEKFNVILGVGKPLEYLNVALGSAAYIQCLTPLGRRSAQFPWCSSLRQSHGPVVSKTSHSGRLDRHWGHLGPSENWWTSELGPDQMLLEGGGIQIRNTNNV